MDYIVNTPCGAVQGTAGRWEAPVQVTHMEKPPMRKLRRTMYGTTHTQNG